MRQLLAGEHGVCEEILDVWNDTSIDGVLESYFLGFSDI